MLKSLVGKNCDLIFRHPRLYLVMLVLLTGFFGFFYATLPVDTSVESLIIENDPDLIFYEEFKEQFGEDEFLVVGFSAPSVLDFEVIRFIDDATTRLEDLEEVKEVISLTSVEDILGSESDFIIQPLISDLPTSVDDIENIRARLRANPMIGNNLISEDERASLFLIRIHGDSVLPAYEAQLVSLVRSEIAKTAAEHGMTTDFHMAGWLVTDVKLSTYMDRDMMRFMPVTYVVLTVLLWVFLRNIWAVLISVVNVSICLVWTLGILNMVGGAMSPMTSILPPLMMALAVSDSVHVFTEFLKRDRRVVELTAVMKQSLHFLAVPCFLTSLTTAAGFISLTTSDIPPIRHFGMAAAGGMMIEFLLTVTILPLGIRFLQHKQALKQAPASVQTRFDGVLGRFSQLVFRAKGKIIICSLVLVGISIIGVMQMTVETNLLEYFKKGSPVYQASQFVDQNLGGANTIEISFRSENLDAFVEPDNLRIIDQVSAYIESWPIVSETTSVVDFLKQMNQAFHNDEPVYHLLPDSRALNAQYLLLYDGDELANFLDSSRQWARLSARATEHNSRVLESYLSDLNHYLDTNFSDSGLEIRITGKTHLANKLVKSIVESQVGSLALAFFLIFGILFFIFRSVWIGLVAVVPNVLPIIFNLGLMGWIGIPLNTATAIISAVAIGIAVDDTIHFLHRYRELRHEGVPVGDSVGQTIVDKGVPILTTSIILSIGFIILTMGSFVPTIQFGFLSALIMVFTVICDLVVLPAVILYWRKAPTASSGQPSTGH